MSVIASVEDTLISTIEKVLSGRVRSVESLAGPWTMADLKRALQFAPCVRVAFLGGIGSRDEDAAVNASFAVYFVAGQVTDQQRKRGSGMIIGIYDMLEIVLPSLNELTISGVGTLLFDDTRPLFTEQTFQMGGAVYAAGFTLPNLILPPADNTSALSDFVTFHADSQLDTDQEPELVTEEVLPQ